MILAASFQLSRPYAAFLSQARGAKGFPAAAKTVAALVQRVCLKYWAEHGFDCAVKYFSLEDMSSLDQLKYLMRLDPDYRQRGR